MPDGLLGVLKLCLLALVYLFFIRVLWAVGAELRGPRLATEPAAGLPPKQSRAQRRAAGRAPQALVGLSGSLAGGAEFALGPELTIGRAPGCAILIDDGFVSQLHARVYFSGDQLVVEDLGSTNGTVVNGHRIESPTVIDRGDVVGIGNTNLEVR
jgi:pSer/pThr/pTyr-binding forkhead associated (FHA) protein